MCEAWGINFYVVYEMNSAIRDYSSHINDCKTIEEILEQIKRVMTYSNYTESKSLLLHFDCKMEAMKISDLAPVSDIAEDKKAELLSKIKDFFPDYSVEIAVSE
jgi:hypothetical protein